MIRNRLRSGADDRCFLRFRKVSEFKDRISKFGDIESKIRG